MDAIEREVAPGLSASSRSGSPPLRRILVVSRTFPSGFELSVNGVYQRFRLFLEAAESISSRLDILFYVEPDFVHRFGPGEFEIALRKHWGIEAKVHFAARDSRVRSWFEANVEPLWSVRTNAEVYKTGGPAQAVSLASHLVEPADLVFAFQFESALPVLAARGVRARYALDLNDVEHIKYPRMLARLPRGIRRSLLHAYWPALFLGERAAVRHSAMTFVCSKAAASELERVTGSPNIRVAPNAVAMPEEDIGAAPRTLTAEAGRTLLFVGIYAYPPNLEGAEFLVRQIFPLIVAQIPDARLVFVGSYIDKIAHLDNGSPNIVMQGFVDDIATAYRDAAVSCCPILAGGGTRTKIIEAAAFRVPVVSTTLGAEGLEFEDETEIFRRDDPASFAQACVDLIRNPAQARAVADRASQRARIYDRRVVIRQIASDLVAAARPDA